MHIHSVSGPCPWVEMFHGPWLIAMPARFHSEFSIGQLFMAREAAKDNRGGTGGRRAPPPPCALFCDRTTSKNITLNNFSIFSERALLAQSGACHIASTCLQLCLHRSHPTLPKLKHGNPKNMVRVPVWVFLMMGVSSLGSWT